MPGKILFFSYCLKCSQPIKLQYSFIINISGWNQSTPQICSRQHLRLLPLRGCGQLCLFSNQIAGLFDHQYLSKESSDILVFCMVLVIKGRQDYWLGVVSCVSHPIILDDSLIINISEKSQIIYQLVFHGDSHRAKVASETFTLVGYGQYCLSSNQIAGLFDHQCLRKESLMAQFFCIEIVSKLVSENTTFGRVWPVKLLIQ